MLCRGQPPEGPDRRQLRDEAKDRHGDERARDALQAGWADLIAFGRPFVANPDLPDRLRNDEPLAEHDRNTLFGGDARGLTDYPVFGAR